MKFFFISNNTIAPSGLSGGDRIYIELARGWKEKAKVSIIGCEEAVIVAKREGLSHTDYYITSPDLKLKNIFSLHAIFINFFIKLTRGILFILKNINIFQGVSFVYSVSDFYPDFLPAFLVKRMKPSCVWIAAFFLFAPAPWAKDNPYKGKNFLRGILYWLSQRPAYWIINSYADFVFVTSEPDKKMFVTKKRNESRVIVIRGGVDIASSTTFLRSKDILPLENRKFDACFVGRFHVQKGVLILVDIWKDVVKMRPSAKLAMIGNGSLEDEVKKKIKEKGLESNIYLFGFLDGDKKFEIFKQSKIVVHPATFDSGGMAAAEAMAWKLPAVGFDLEALKTYYPRGMVKAHLGDIRGFAAAIMHLLTNSEFYEKTAAEARDLITQEWSWQNRAEEIYACVMES